jgi:D-proline reductase (dithiol) PrdB
MTHFEDIPARTRANVIKLDCPTFKEAPFIGGPPLRQRRVALISSAGLHRRADQRFAGGSADYRVLPNDIDRNDILMSHVSVNFDRTGFQQDLNVVLPLDRLAELTGDGVIGSVASTHYSFMGATDPVKMEENAAQVAGMLKADRVDAVLLVPV